MLHSLNALSPFPNILKPSLRSCPFYIYITCQKNASSRQKKPPHSRSKETSPGSLDEKVLTSRIMHVCAILTTA